MKTISGPARGVLTILRRFVDLRAHLAGLIAMALMSPVAAAEPVRLLVAVTETDQPLRVWFRTDGDNARTWAFGGGLLGYLLSDSIRSARSSEFEQTLAKAVPDLARRPVWERETKKQFEAKYPVFAIEFAERPADYVADGKIDYARLAADGHLFMLVVEDKFSGLSMLNAIATKTDDVAPTVVAKYRLVDVRARKVLTKGDASGFGLAKRPVREAVADGPFLTNAYESIVATAMFNLVGQLFRTDNLHYMAKAQGAADAVPPVTKLLKRYETQFDYKPHVPKDWHTVKMGTKYLLVVEPKSEDRAVFGVRHEMDLLLPEFGQDVQSVEEYATMYIGRLADIGYKPDTVREFTEIATDVPYKAFVIDRPEDGGKDVFFMRLAEPPFIETTAVVFIRDHQALLARYGDSIRAILEQSKTTVKTQR